MVRQYLLDNPEVIIEAIDALRERQKADSTRLLQKTLASRRGELENDPTSPVAGNPGGNVTVVEFLDYNCPYCKKVFPRVRRPPRNRRQDSLRAQGIPHPRPAIGGGGAGRPGDLETGFGNVHAFPRGDDEVEGEAVGGHDLRSGGGEAGLDPGLLKKAMAEPWIDEALQKNIELAESLGITGTPAFIIGNHVIPGAIDLNTLKQLVAAARKG